MINAAAIHHALRPRHIDLWLTDTAIFIPPYAPA
jgi:hypothetical protein